ncbi:MULTISPECIES: hypothetical protein [Tenacibaculum]|uniref:Uncharacterized protein n=1 Tax=Tenacibaculum singaporense TaxID=2358479 RepID=A0A3S8RA24_9FLAO|nr:hypothetical protein [Tenacibaculum singaporense]AZJ36585.1 hypothetical protein D6T69_14020 [Tenacibaculum singaporense]RSC96111.1 hypothetical protein EI424_03045 [Tenacibaculum singaporense]
MKKNIKNTNQNSKDITRKEALKKIGSYGKYAALTALGTYMILNPQKAQAASPERPGDGF